MAEKERKPPAPDESQIYKRPRWRHASKVFGALVIIILNIVLVGSAIDRHSKGLPLKWQQELLTGAFVLFCDVTILIPMILEADSVIVYDDKIMLNCLFFKRSIAWSDITDFNSPDFLKLATLRTRRCFYLLNKNQLPNYEHLARAIREHRSGLIKPV